VCETFNFGGLRNLAGTSKGDHFPASVGAMLTRLQREENT
jgi:hypothetical protein